jgi:hypothetical protein
VYSGPELRPSVHAAHVPRAVAVGDLDGDGRLDMVAAGDETPPVTTLLGADDFDPVTYDGPRATGIATADMDGDGLLDVVTGDFNSVSIYRNLGGGVLDAPQSYGGGGGYLVVGDFDGDGRPDVATAIEPLLTIWLNHDGALVMSQQIQPPTGPWRIATADVNEDGILDLVTTDLSLGFSGVAGETFSVRLGHGDGTFADPVAFETGMTPWAFAVADTDGDHHVDVVVEQLRNILVFKGAGDGSFSLARTTALPQQEMAPIGLGPCTVNDCQLFVGGTQMHSLQLADPTSVPVLHAPGTNLSAPWQLLVTDLDADGAPEVIVADSYAGSIP